ncbi:M23 family metallopeptidase [Cryobacterium sp. TMT2-10]|uniref:M23 family metallopeptidase n=1 Tax=Cryobacterium sp. TMT2-10 TaxID=1259244 RepID=UPI00106B62DD|nr:M23 family metallopeptidase [Cryobacterium sp. TMT2-10]TFD41759.1 M23 family metallopeptidase [Cryobacterium sp. TMT2-10]
MPSIILAARGGITTRFREDIGRGFPHNGIDQGHGDGNAVDLEIRAPAAGVVIAHGWFGTYGNRIVIKHPDGWTSLLAHHASQAVSSGDTVKQGQILAVMGNTGTKFVHSHQELRMADGSQVDPLLNLGSSSAALDSAPLAEKRRPMSVLIRNYNGSMGLLTEDGELIPLNSMTEVDSLRATGLVGDWVQMPDGLVWNTLTAITGRKLAQRTGNPDAVAAALAPLLVSAVVAGLAGKGSGLTAVEVEAATEAAVRAVFADAAK